MRVASAGQLHLFKGKRQRGERPKDPLEFQIACAFADTLRQFARSNWRWTHVGHGEHRETVTGERLRRMGLRKGWPDYLFISPTGVLHCLELKRKRGGELSDEQAAFRDFCKRSGVPWRLARTYDAAIAIVTEWDVLKVEVRPQ